MSTAEQPTIRLLVTDRDPALREGLAGLLSRVQGFEIVGVVAPEAARSEAAVIPVDAVLLDVAKPHEDSVQVCQELCALSPQPTVIALTTFADPEEERALRDAGAAAYVLKEVQLERLTQVVRRVFILFWVTSRQPVAPAAPSVPQAATGALSSSEVLAILMRSALGPNDTSVDVLYAPPWYFEWNHRPPPDTDRPVLVFFLFENIHASTLVPELPTALLDVDGRQFEPVSVALYSEAPHHRISQVLFSAVDETGAPLLTDRTGRMSLLLPTHGVVSAGNTVTWDLPLPYGAGAIGEVPTPASPLGRLGLTWASFVAILGGMLTALSPCLLQLSAYYAAALAGTGAEFAASPEKMAHARRGLLKTALFFVVGFVAVYTAGGAVAGYVGQSLQRLGDYEPWLRPIGIAAGILIILLAVRTAARARVPLVCRLPLVAPRPGQASGVLASALMGLSFAVGCLSCFSATVLSALLLYAGATGSPLTGALLLFVFSLGIGSVFLLAALLAAEALPLLTFLHRAQPIVGLTSAVIMAGFGVLMITNSFHAVSGFLYRLFFAG